MKLTPSSAAINSILLAAISLPTTAALADDHEQRQLEAHVHGVTTLNVAFENGVLDLELEGPGMNFVGFEHAPRTDEQRQAVANALELLKGDDQLFRTSPAAGCALVKANADHVMEGGHDENHHDKHDGDHHDDEHQDHDNDHDDHDEDHHEHGSDHANHEEHDDHDEGHDDHDHEHDHEGGAQHSEFVGQYQFRCAQPEQLTELRVALFERFPRTEEVETSFIGPDLQTFKSLTPADPVLETRR